MDNMKVSLAVMDALGRLGIAHDIMEMETTEKTRPWQEGLVRLALKQGKNITTEEREALEGFLEQGGNEMKKRIFWGWQWAYGLGCHTEVRGETLPCGELYSFDSKKSRDEWLECGTWRVAKTRGEAMKLLRRGWTGNDEFDWEVTLRKMDGLDPLTDSELLELWKQTEDED